MNIAVRLATREDARAIAEVHVRAWQDGYKGVMPQTYLDGLSDQIEQRTEFWGTRFVQTERHKTWVGSLDEEIVGIATAGRAREVSDGSGELWMINVIGRAWGTGVGQSLMDTATQHLRVAGFPFATLWVLDSNVRARRFYERNGWFTDGATQDDDERGFTLHEVRYRIELQSS